MTTMTACHRFRFLRPLHNQILSLSNSRTFSSITGFLKHPRNPNLKQVISQGMPYLEACTSDVLQKCGRDSLFSRLNNIGPSPRQLSEASRILSTVTNVVHHVATADTTRGGSDICIQSFPIVILDVEVSPDCKQARVFWCLPLHLCDLKPDQETLVQERMQQILEKGRGGRMIQSGVYSQLRFYYPPKLRFVPVPIQVAMESFLQG